MVVKLGKRAQEAKRRLSMQNERQLATELESSTIDTLPLESSRSSLSIASSLSSAYLTRNCTKSAEDGDASPIGIRQRGNSVSLPPTPVLGMPMPVLPYARPTSPRPPLYGATAIEKAPGIGKAPSWKATDDSNFEKNRQDRD